MQPPPPMPPPPAPPPNAATRFSSCSISSRPALFWKRDIRLTTRGRAAIGVDGKHVGGAAEGADGYPAAVLAETHVLDLDRDRTSTERTEALVSHL
ncbi:hypothetical protein EYF80_008964 [Liparis tanakae]|uniref:Uncharacterized protein n=1 Tax=Liparis tanakae TaxID=230148 RepID=A0A4Z2IRT6_9TELE|nr:hypothetical protein EYF80_008964 [Liparis tanakae]